MLFEFLAALFVGWLVVISPSPDLRAPVLLLIGRTPPHKAVPSPPLSSAYDPPRQTFEPVSVVLENIVNGARPLATNFPLLATHESLAGGSDPAAFPAVDGNSGIFGLRSLVEAWSTYWSNSIDPFLRSELFLTCSAALQFLLVAFLLAEIIGRRIRALRRARRSRAPIQLFAFTQMTAPRPHLQGREAPLCDEIQADAGLCNTTPILWDPATLRRLTNVEHDKETYLDMIERSTAELNAAKAKVDSLQTQILAQCTALHEMQKQETVLEGRAFTARKERDAAEVIASEAFQLRDEAIVARDELARELKEVKSRLEEPTDVKSQLEEPRVVESRAKQDEPADTTHDPEEDLAVPAHESPEDVMDPTATDTQQDIDEPEEGHKSKKHTRGRRAGRRHNKRAKPQEPSESASTNAETEQ